MVLVSVKHCEQVCTKRGYIKDNKLINKGRTIAITNVNPSSVAIRTAIRRALTSTIR